MSDDCSDASSEEFVLDLGGPTLMDKWAPKIAEMRANGDKWTEIAEVTGLDLNRAYRTWKRYVDAKKVKDNSDSEATSESSDSDNDASDDAPSPDAAA